MPVLPAIICNHVAEIFANLCSVVVPLHLLRKAFFQGERSTFSDRLVVIRTRSLGSISASDKLSARFGTFLAICAVGLLDLVTFPKSLILEPFGHRALRFFVKNCSLVA